MASNLSEVLRLISEELAGLQEKRETLIGEVREIDSKITTIAEKLGLTDKIPNTDSDLSRLTHEPRVDHRTEGTLPDEMMEILRNADRGYSRVDLKRLLRESKVGHTIEKNENTFYNAVKRYIDRKKVVDIDGMLYHAGRAPIVEQAEGSSEGAERLPHNVTLFTAKKTAADQ